MTPTYSKHDRVTLRMPDGATKTVTIVKLFHESDTYAAVTGSGTRLVIEPADIVGLA